MDVKVVEMEKNYVRLIVKGEDHTFLNLLQHYLLENEAVVIAKYHIPHPLVGEPELFVKTNGKNPIQVIKEVNRRIVQECSALLSQL